MSRIKKFFIGLLLIAVAVIIVVSIMRIDRLGNFFIPGKRVGGSAGDYQAVFLTNSQVYFGKLSNLSSQFPVLTDVYYLQINNPETSPIRPEDVNLIKLGSELHGPTDEMRLNRDHILIVEDLKSDSSVIDAINRFKESDAQNN